MPTRARRRKPSETPACARWERPGSTALLLRGCTCAFCHVHDCFVARADAGQRIVFRWGFVGPGRKDGPAFDSLLTITLRGAPGGATRLTLVHERLDDLAA